MQYLAFRTVRRWVGVWVSGWAAGRASKCVHTRSSGKGHLILRDVNQLFAGGPKRVLLDDRKRGAVLRTVMLAVRRSSVRDRARMAPSYLIIEVARLVEARSIALSIAEPPRWTPGTAVAVPLHEAERHRCIAMALWYTGAEVRARSDQGNAGYVPLGSHHRRIVIPITVRQVKVASLRRQSLSMPAPNTAHQTLP